MAGRTVDAARLEAEGRYPYKAVVFGGAVLDDQRIEGFVAGAEWQAAQPVVVRAEQVSRAVKKANGGRANPEDDGWVANVLAALNIAVEVSA